MDERPTLQEIARRIIDTTAWVDEQVVTEALLEAGIDSKDANERKRLVFLVRSGLHTEEVDELIASYAVYPEYFEAMPALDAELPPPKTKEELEQRRKLLSHFRELKRRDQQEQE